MAENDPTSNPGTSQPNHYPFLGRKIQDGDLGSLDGYRVKRLLGQGGMGYVFLGEDIHLGREVALKVMRPEEKNKACARERFILEGRAVASITNDHVVIIHQVGEAQGIHYLAMELLHGMALDKWMEKQTSPVSFVVACKLIRDTLRGLAAAHEAGLVHRDITFQPVAGGENRSRQSSGFRPHPGYPFRGKPHPGRNAGRHTSLYVPGTSHWQTGFSPV